MSNHKAFPSVLPNFTPFESVTKGITIPYTSGIELVRKKLDKEVYGMVMPLVTDSNGVKFGKTEGNALWLDKNKTSSYELYQYLVNLEDSMIIEYLKKLTFLTKQEIEKLEIKHKENPHLREAHKALAREVITDLHGVEEYESAVKISECLFNGKVNELNSDQLESAFKGVPSFSVTLDEKIIESERNKLLDKYNN